MPVPGRSDAWTLDSLRHGDVEGSAWRPAETDVSIRPGWFWHEHEEPRTPEDLFGLYLTSVGRNSKLLLNVPPTREGLLDPADVAALSGFHALLATVLGTDLLAGAEVEADDGGSLVLTPPGPIVANLLSVGEDIEHGQHVAAWRVEVDDGSGMWRPLTAGTTIGHRRTVRFPPTEVRGLRLLIDLAYGPVRVTDVSLHHDPGGELRRRADNHD